MLLFVYTTTRKRFVIFTSRYFKLTWNTTALSQSNCRNFSCSSIKLSNQRNMLQRTLSLYKKELWTERETFRKLEWFPERSVNFFSVLSRENSTNFKWRYFRRSGHCNLNNCKWTRKKNRDFNGIRTYGLCVKDPYIGSRQICWVHLNPWVEWSNEDDANWGNTNFKWRYDRRSRNCNLGNCTLTRKKIRIQQSPLQYSALFAVRQSRVDLITFKIIS